MAIPRSSLTFSTMKNTGFNLLLVQGLVVLFVSDIVTSHGPGEITEEGSSSNLEPQLDRSGSVNTRSENYIEAEKRRLLEERLADRAGHYGHEIRSGKAPMHERQDSTDSLFDRSEDFIKKNWEEIAKRTPVPTPVHPSYQAETPDYQAPTHERQDSTDSLFERSEDFIKKNREEIGRRTPLPTPVHPFYQAESPDYLSDTEDMNKKGCFGKCLSFNRKDKDY